MVKQRPKSMILVTTSTAIAIATKIYGATSGIIGAASGTTIVIDSLLAFFSYPNAD